MEVIIKEPHKEAYAKEIDDTTEAVQKIVGGYIEAYDIDFNICILCDEDGRLKQKEVNLEFDDEENIVGTVVFCGLDEKNEFCSLHPIQEEIIKNFVKEWGV